MALGHPLGALWSITSGVVSAVHQGAIQHDAPLNPGSSGGPLLEEDGCLLGIHSTKLFGEAEGVGFARPVSLAMRVVGEGADELAMDLSSPASAARSCLRAQELASRAVLECYDWDHRLAIVHQAAQQVEALGLLPPGMVARQLAAEGGDAEELARMKRGMLHYFLSLQDEAVDEPELAAMPPASLIGRLGIDGQQLQEQRAALIERQAGLRLQGSQRVQADNDLPLEDDVGESARQLVRGGTRIDDVEPVGPDLAWVAISGRNPDESASHWSELYRRQQDGTWRQLDPVLPTHLDSLPAGWSRPLSSLDAALTSHQLEILGQVIWSQATQAGRIAARQAIAASEDQAAPWGKAAGPPVAGTPATGTPAAGTPVTGTAAPEGIERGEAVGQAL